MKIFSEGNLLVSLGWGWYRRESKAGIPLFGSDERSEILIDTNRPVLLEIRYSVSTKSQKEIGVSFTQGELTLSTLRLKEPFERASDRRLFVSTVPGTNRIVCISSSHALGKDDNYDETKDPDLAFHFSRFRILAK